MSVKLIDQSIFCLSASFIILSSSLSVREPSGPKRGQATPGRFTIIILVLSTRLNITTITRRLGFVQTAARSAGHDNLHARMLCSTSGTLTATYHYLWLFSCTGITKMSYICYSVILPPKQSAVLRPTIYEAWCLVMCRPTGWMLDPSTRIWQEITNSRMYWLWSIIGKTRRDKIRNDVTQNTLADKKERATNNVMRNFWWLLRARNFRYGVSRDFSVSMAVELLVGYLYTVSQNKHPCREMQSLYW